MLHAASELFEESPGGRRIGVRCLCRELHLDRERDEVLLDAVVEVALDRTSVGISGEDKAPQRGTQSFVLS